MREPDKIEVTGGPSAHPQREVTGWAMVRLSVFLGWQDVRLMYRRTVLGQFWITLAMVVTFAAIGSVFGFIFKSPVVEYLPFLGCGLVLFAFLSSVVTDGAQAFITAEAFIRQLPLPPLVHFLRAVWKAVFVLAHNAVALFVLFLVYPQDVSAATALVVPGLVLSVAGVAGLGLAVAMLATRFRDVPQIIAAVIQVTFYLTPIVWLPSALPAGPRELLLTWNPFYHFIEVVRGPLLGAAPPPREWLLTSALAAVCVLAGVMAYRWKRRELAFWV